MIKHTTTGPPFTASTISQCLFNHKSTSGLRHLLYDSISERPSDPITLEIPAPDIALVTKISTRVPLEYIPVQIRENTQEEAPQ